MGRAGREGARVVCGAEVRFPSGSVVIWLPLYSFFIYHTSAGRGVKENTRAGRAEFAGTWGTAKGECQKKLRYASWMRTTRLGDRDGRGVSRAEIDVSESEEDAGVFPK
jgi:hypothetical protein